MIFAAGATQKLRSILPPLAEISPIFLRYLIEDKQFKNEYYLQDHIYTSDLLIISQL